MKAVYSQECVPQTGRRVRAADCQVAAGGLRATTAQGGGTGVGGKSRFSVRTVSVFSQRSVENNNSYIVYLRYSVICNYKNNLAS